MKKYDVVIAGGGPAGLSLAADLSKDFDVLVVEKEKAGTTTRSWYTFQDRIKKNGLNDAVVATPENVTFYMDEESNITYKDKHALVNENCVLKIFKEKAESNSCKIISNTPVIDFKYNGAGIILKTNRGNYYGNLLIDCMGATSPIVFKRNLQKEFNVWIVYGMRAKNTRFFDTNTIGFYKMPEKYQPKNDKTNYMFGIYPKSRSEGDIYLFNYYDRILKPEILMQMFKKSVGEFLPKYKNTGVLKGWIYNGVLKKYALDRVLFVGESGCLTPPAIGMGFNEILRKHGIISERLRYKINHEHDLSSHALSDTLLDCRNSASYTFLKICQKYFYYGNNAEAWKRGILILNKAGKVFTRKWMRNELDYSLIKKGMTSMIDVVGWTGLLGILPAEEFIKLSLEAMNIMGSSVIEDAHLAFHRQYRDKPSELCKHCHCRYRISKTKNKM